MKPQLQRSMGLADVALFFIIAATNLQWVAASAAAGPTSLFAWGVGCLAMFAPLCIVVVHLSARYPREGGMYVWATHAFGPFAGFMTAWTYWYSTLVYFPGLLYFTAGNTGVHAAPLTYIGIALGGLVLATWLNVLGLDIGKRLVNIAAFCRSAVIVLLVVLGALWWWRYGIATALNAQTLHPTFALKELIFFSYIAFAFVGPEALPFMAEEVRDPKRSIPRGLAIAAPSIVGIYVLGTLGLFAMLPPAKTDGLYGVLQGIGVASAHFGGSVLVAVCSLLIVVSCLGSVTAWMGANARLPFVAGIDNYLPRAFGRLHPKYGSPVVSLVVQSAISAVLIVLGQSGETVKTAYDILLSAAVLATMIPFIGMFGAGIKLGGNTVVRVAGVIGMCTVTAALVLSAFPAPEEPNKGAAVIKILGFNAALVIIGAVVYAVQARRRNVTLGRQASEA